MAEQAQIAIIGAGPTGCATAIYLARAGVDVLLIDRTDPPTPGVGESLLPVCAPILAELGVDMHDFLPKHGAVFTRADDSVRFPFSEAMRTEYSYAWQTPRDQLDARMRAAARSAGARFLRANITDMQLPGTLVTDAGTVTADFIADAGGRGQLLARKLDITQPHPWLKNIAQHGWFTGVQPQAPEVAGDIVLAAYEGGWFWFIPFADDTWSVGAVTTPSGPKGSKRFELALERCEAAQVRLATATQVGSFQGTGTISVSSSVFHGEGWALIGDSATFLDPIFSSGVALGLHAAKGFAESYLAGGSLDSWEADCRAAVAAFELVVKCYYDDIFLDIALADPSRHHPTARKAIISLLAGDVFDPEFTAPKRFGARFDSIHRMVTRP